MADASVGGAAPAILPSPVIAGAPADATPNRLVEALVALSEHHGRAMSAASLMIGLPLERHELPLDLLERAAERAGLVAEWTDVPHVKRISPLVLPAILLTKDGTCVVVQAADPKTRTFEVLDPVSRAVSQVAAKALQKTSARRLAVVRPSDGRSVSGMEGEDRPHWFWSVVTRFWPNYVQVLLGALFINLLALAVPLFSMTVFDRVVPNFAETTLWTLAIGASLALVFDVVLRTVRAVIVEVVGRRTDLILSSRIFEHVLAVRLSNRPAMAGAFASQIREFDAVREFFTSASLVAAIDFLFIGLFIGVMFLVAGPLAWVAVAAIPAVALITLLAQIPLGKAVERGQREAATRHAVLVEAVSSLDTVKSVGAEGRMQRNWERSVAAAARANHDSRFWATAVLNLTSAIQQGVTIVILVWGVYLVNAGTITMGAMVAATILAGRALAPLAGIAATLTRAQQTRSALRTLDKVMAMPSERGAAKGVVRPVATGALRFDSVTFAYPDAASPALRDVSFSIASGERVGLIGRVGSGKSTIGRLANGLYMPERGSVLVDGVDTRQFDMASLRQGVAYVSQDPALFLGSLRDNIAIGRPGATDAEVLAAARQAGVDDFAARHPRGYDMVIGEGGRTLSGGQRQAVALARALLTHPKLLFLDEPSSAMDSLTEAMLTERIEQLLDPTMTLVVSTHRLSMLRLATRVLVLDQGRIIADGPRDAILERLAREAGQQQARNDRGAA